LVPLDEDTIIHSIAKTPPGYRGQRSADDVRFCGGDHRKGFAKGVPVSGRPSGPHHASGHAGPVGEPLELHVLPSIEKIVQAALNRSSFDIVVSAHEAWQKLTAGEWNLGEWAPGADQ